ncbi:putative phospholipid-transporting ATPase NEO1 [Cyphellophora attinorum]|uniref:Putative phospholipid-transporting ATPase NEO1 n=1 Tax=Cyphellophora attinorum TaxID=1664694 RepID=A0A0N0NNJ7_9EURO|nr:putative phospholipid-transporting ATPase NEO1 [Phialophora attinorum]KPI41608.1 putative phospholipid-transporting ATPase NEO1 [Phialophora attinorum]
MADSHNYHQPFDPDAASDDDLNLDELDPVNGGATVPGSRSQYSGDGRAVPLQDLADSGRFWKTKRSRRHFRDGEDEENLLGGWNLRSEGQTEDRGWNVRRQRRKDVQGTGESANNSHQTHSRAHSFRQSISLPEIARQALADEGDIAQATNDQPREIAVARPQKKKFPANVVSNAKYTAWSFLPVTLYNEFRFFLNVYFLLVALSQILPFLRIGYMSTYIVPLACVLAISIGKEAFDDVGRRRRDAEANAEPFTVLLLGSQAGRRSAAGAPEIQKRSRDIRVGDILKLEKNQRVPADVVILQSITGDGSMINDPSASAASEAFIRTDQLDGETDWKLRLPCPLTQGLKVDDFTKLRISAGAPDRDVNSFAGKVDFVDPTSQQYDPHLSLSDASDVSHPDDVTSKAPPSAPLTIDNTAWCNTVIASNTTVYAAVIYTGKQTRSALSTSPSRSKTGLLELEINNLTKILCIMTLTLSIVLVALEGFEPSNKKPWYIAITIYLILFSTIIPISLRVNLDMGKTVYSYYIERDRDIPDTVVRTSTIPEDLGRIEYLLSDKTGTLTQNEMLLKKIHIGTGAYGGEAMDEVQGYINEAFGGPDSHGEMNGNTDKNRRRNIGVRVRDLVIALALCHNVTPTKDEVDGNETISYQASSPDEIAIVEFTESVGLRLFHRDRQSISVQSVQTGNIVLKAVIRDIFPFTSDSKRMGIIVDLTTISTDGETTELCSTRKAQTR